VEWNGMPPSAGNSEAILRVTYRHLPLGLYQVLRERFGFFLHLLNLTLVVSALRIGGSGGLPRPYQLVSSVRSITSKYQYNSLWSVVCSYSPSSFTSQMQSKPSFRL
jgi:hypothetical protein